MPEDARVWLLGGFQVTVGGVPVELTAGGDRLVALLACRRDVLPRHVVAGLLWPDVSDGRAQANLRSALYRLPEQCRRGLVVSSARRVGLASGVQVDLAAAVAAAERLVNGAAVPADLAGGGMVRGLLVFDVLPDWYELDWVIEERESFRQLRLHALEILCKRLAETGWYGGAVAAGLAAVRAEPLRESAHRALITAHLEEGNYGEAARQYQRCRMLLREELGVDPSPRLQQLLGDARWLPRQRDGAATPRVAALPNVGRGCGTH